MYKIQTNINYERRRRRRRRRSQIHKKNVLLLRYSMNSIVNWIRNFSLCSDCDSISFQWCVNWLGLCVKYGKKKIIQNTPFRKKKKGKRVDFRQFPSHLLSSSSLLLCHRLAQESWVWWGDADWWDTALLQNKNLNNAHGSCCCYCYWLWLPLPSLPFIFYYNKISIG